MFVIFVVNLYSSEYDRMDATFNMYGWSSGIFQRSIALAFPFAFCIFKVSLFLFAKCIFPAKVNW